MKLTYELFCECFVRVTNLLNNVTFMTNSLFCNWTFSFLQQLILLYSSFKLSIEVDFCKNSFYWLIGIFHGVARLKILVVQSGGARRVVVVNSLPR